MIVDVSLPVSAVAQGAVFLIVSSCSCRFFSRLFRDLKGCGRALAQGQQDQWEGVDDQLSQESILHLWESEKAAGTGFDVCKQASTAVIFRKSAGMVRRRFQEKT
jgi:hypothetical protein